MRIRRTWNPYEAGYWHALNAEAVEHFKREHVGDPQDRKGSWRHLSWRQIDYWRPQECSLAGAVAFAARLLWI